LGGTSGEQRRRGLCPTTVGCAPPQDALAGAQGHFLQARKPGTLPTRNRLDSGERPVESNRTEGGEAVEARANSEGRHRGRPGCQVQLLHFGTRSGRGPGPHILSPRAQVQGNMEHKRLVRRGRQPFQRGQMSRGESTGWLAVVRQTPATSAWLVDCKGVAAL